MRDLPLLPLVLFVATYLGLAAGRIPRLALDRTGCALLGAIAFLASGTLDLGQAAAGVDTAALAVLFGMMLLSEQYQLSGLYAAIGDRLARVSDPRHLLAGTILVAAALSAVLTGPPPGTLSPSPAPSRAMPCSWAASPTSSSPSGQPRSESASASATTCASDCR